MVYVKLPNGKEMGAFKYNFMHILYLPWDFIIRYNLK